MLGIKTSTRCIKPITHKPNLKKESLQSSKAIMVAAGEIENEIQNSSLITRLIHNGFVGTGLVNVSQRQPMNQGLKGGMLSRIEREEKSDGRIERFGNDLVESSLEIQKEFKIINGRIDKQLNNFEIRQLQAQKELEKILQEYLNNPGALKEKFKLSDGIDNIPKFLSDLVVAPTNFAFIAAKQQFELITLAIDLIIKNSEAFTSVLFNKFKAHADARLKELEVLSKEIDLRDMEAQNKIKQDAAKLQMELEKDKHEFDKVAKMFDQNLKLEDSLHTRELDTKKLELEKEIQRANIVLQKENLEHEKKLTMIKLNNAREFRLADIKRKIREKEIEVNGATNAAQERARADVEVAKNKSNDCVIA